MRAEIRCCCDPCLLLGYVELKQDHIRQGQVLRFHLRPMWRLKPWEKQRDGELIEFISSEPLELPVERVQGIDRATGEYLHCLAIKSNDTPIEKLRRIPGFSEPERRSPYGYYGRGESRR